MPSDKRKKQRERQKKATDTESTSSKGLNNDTTDLDTSNRTCTGVLTSHPDSRDIQIISLNLLFHGHELLKDTQLELNYGRYIPLLKFNQIQFKILK